MAPASVRRLLGSFFDFAGLFPPASLSLETTARRYVRHATGPDAWALGRIVVPAAQVAELATALPLPETGSPWPVAVLVGPDVEADRSRVLAVADRDRRVRIAALEARATAAAEIESLARRLRTGAPDDLALYLELPLAAMDGAALDEIARRGLRAKARTGGTTEAAIPPPATLAAFLHGCVSRGLSFKVTAGLHHAYRGTYPLTYDRDSPRGLLHGFLNVLAATALVVAGLSREPAERALEETEPGAFRLEGEGLAWRECRVDGGAIDQTRRLLVACGTCSFQEPMDDLRMPGASAR